MGIDYVNFERLCALSTRFKPRGRTLMLGRQAFQIESPFAKLYEAALTKYDLPRKRFVYLQEDGFCETLMRKLGFGEMEAMDFSDYEGATVLHDLNKPIPPELEQQFDFIFDGGTLEHVFNVPVALESIFRMLKPGGRFVSSNGMNGFNGHGLYQFGPDLVWTFWKRRAGCAVHDCRGITKAPEELQEYHLPFPDPADLGRRLRLKGRVPPGRFYLYYEIERLPSSVLQESVLQSDYETKWDGSTNAGAIRFDEAAAPEGPPPEPEPPAKEPVFVHASRVPDPQELEAGLIAFDGDAVPDLPGIALAEPEEAAASSSELGMSAIAEPAAPAQEPPAEPAKEAVGAPVDENVIAFDAEALPDLPKGI